MSKRLVAYFSASGVTAKVAENLADAIGADIFEIQPEVPYTKADLNWMDKKSRSTIEMSDPTSRPAIAAKRDNMDEYDTIFDGIKPVKNDRFTVFTLVISHRAVGKAVELSKLRNVIPDVFVVSVENMCSVFMDIDALDIFRVNITRNIWTFVYY